MSPERATRSLRVALVVIALLSPAALSLGVRSGQLTPPPPATASDLLGLAWPVGGLVLALLALCVVGHVLDTRTGARRDTP